MPKQNSKRKKPAKRQHSDNEQNDNDDDEEDNMSVVDEAHDDEDDGAASSTSTLATKTSTTSRGSVGQRKGRRSAKNVRKTRKPMPGYKFNASYTENHKLVIYGVVFNHFLPQNQASIFATVGSNRCTIYECGAENHGIKLLHCYADPDPEEAFYTCAWSYERQSLAPLIVVGGQRGVIRIINLEQQQRHLTLSLIGHGGAINQLKVHPIQVHLLLSCSKDYGIRLWNMETQALIAIFAGVEGHRAETLSIDFDLRGNGFVSGGMDHALKLWDISSAKFEESIALSAKYNAKRAVAKFPTLMEHYPSFSTREIHGNYVDCVQWFGNYIISKSCQDVIVIWHVGERRRGNGGKWKPEFIAQYKCNNCELWFVRFDFNIWRHMLACGNELGKIYVWELSQAGPYDARAYILTRRECKTAVRQVAFSKDAQILIGVCDDGTIWRWNRI